MKGYPHQDKRDGGGPCLATCAPAPGTGARNAKDILPLPHAADPGVGATSPPGPLGPPPPHGVVLGGLDAAYVPTIPYSHVTVLDAALRIIGVDLAQLDLGEDHPGQAREELVDVLAGEGGDVDRDGDVGFGGPSRGGFAADFAAEGRRGGALFGAHGAGRAEGSGAASGIEWEEGLST